MTAKEYLGQVRRLSDEIARKQQRVKSLTLLTGCRAANITGMPKNPSPDASPMENVMCEIVDLETEICADEVRLEALRFDVGLTITQVERAEYSAVLFKRYVELKTWRVIADELDYSRRWVQKLHGKALFCFTKNWTHTVHP